MPTNPRNTKPHRACPNHVRHTFCAVEIVVENVLVTEDWDMDETDFSGSALQGGQFLNRAQVLFERLRSVGTEKDSAGNRRLLFSHYASLVLLSFFNPAMQSLRGLQRASECERVQKLLGGGRVSLGALSESVRVFDPALLEPMVQELVAELPVAHPGPGPGRAIASSIPHELAQQLRAVDGTSLRALPQIVSMAGKARGEGKWKLHLHFRPLSGTPAKATITRDQVQGEGDERQVLAETLESGCVYINDRGYERYSLLNEIVAAQSDYVTRVQERPLEIEEARPLSAAAIEARVVSDEVGRLMPSKKTEGVNHPVRRIVLRKREQGRWRSDRTSSDQVILLTNLLDVPAEVIAAIYELRWSIELFFRFLKHVLGCRRLLSNRSEGIAIQIYCALIACLLLAQATGGSVGKVSMDLICLYLQGWATEAELITALAKHRASEELRKAREARQR